MRRSSGVAILVVVGALGLQSGAGRCPRPLTTTSIHPLFAGSALSRRTTVDPSSVPRRNFIDEEVFGRLESAEVRAAAPATDAEFLRRLRLDLTGLLPTPEEIRRFSAITDPDKRAAAIEEALDSPFFNDRWTQWFVVDTMKQTLNLARNYSGRNAFDSWLRSALKQRVSIRDMAIAAVSSSGNNFDEATGMANFTLVQAPAGPPQDTADLAFSRAASAFLGLGHYDCILCHNGRGHLDQLSLWGSRAPRAEAYQMAAFFIRMRYESVPLGGEYFDSTKVVDAKSGVYELNTRYGNRPQRRPLADNTFVTPAYRVTGAEPASEDWRRAFGEFMVEDPMFARNFANRIWKQMMGLGFVEPVDSLDPDRLDPANPPPEPWTLQASHPLLLEKLAAKLVEFNYDLRAFVRFIAQSSAYQLSARYDGAWKPDYETLFARRVPRRLSAFETHDAIVRATGVMSGFKTRTTPGYMNHRLLWAVQLPIPLVAEETDEVTFPFIGSLYRGGSILQQLNLLNSGFVLSRVKLTGSATLRSVAAIPDNGRAVEELFLLFLSRPPEDEERAVALEQLTRARNTAERNAAIEDLAWTLVNKLDFTLNL